MLTMSNFSIDPQFPAGKQVTNKEYLVYDETWEEICKYQNDNDYRERETQPAEWHD